MQATSNENMMLKAVSTLENAVVEYVEGGFSGKSLDAARMALATALATSCSISISQKFSLEIVLSQLEAANTGQRMAAVLLMRALVIDDLVGTEDPGSKASRIVPQFIEQSVPDIAKHLKTADKRQNYEKLKVFHSFHGYVVSNLEIFNNLTPDLAEIKNLDVNLRRPFANKLFQTYLQPFGFGAVKGKVESILDQVSKLVSCTDARYKAYFDQLSEDVGELKRLCIDIGTFFTTGPIMGFVEVMQRAINALENSASELFYCSVVPKRKSVKAAEKNIHFTKQDGLYFSPFRWKTRAQDWL